MNCCDKQELKVNQVVEYLCEVFNSELCISGNDNQQYMDNLRCINCNKIFDLEKIPYSMPFLEIA